MNYPFKCVNADCNTAYFEVIESYEEGKTYDSRPCPECNVEGKRIYTIPHVIYKGLGFSTTDNEYEKQLQLAEAVADKSYSKQAEKYMEKNAISKDDKFWNELAKQEFHKDGVKGNIYSTPPTTVLPEHEAKASRNIAQSGSTLIAKKPSKVKPRKPRQEK